MTADAFAVLQFIFINCLRIFNSWYIPGTHTTPFEFAMFSLSLILLIRVIRLVVGVVNVSGGEGE